MQPTLVAWTSTRINWRRRLYPGEFYIVNQSSRFAWHLVLPQFGRLQCILQSPGVQYLVTLLELYCRTYWEHWAWNSRKNYSVLCACIWVSATYCSLLLGFGFWFCSSASLCSGCQRSGKEIRLSNDNSIWSSLWWWDHMIAWFVWVDILAVFNCVGYSSGYIWC